MNTLKTLLFLAVFSFQSFAQGSLLILEGEIPGQYLGRSKTSFIHGALVMASPGHKTKDLRGTILAILDLTDADQQKALEDFKKESGSQYLKLERKKGEWDVIYPGLIDLHNHTKQNNLGVWEHAHGQFANRFEWRAWNIYKKSVSGNMNPWIGFGKAINCAAFRWSELQAMVVGTTYLQGPSSCVRDFAIHRVEDSKAFGGSERKAVQAPTDLILPGDMTYVWNTLRPGIEAIQKDNCGKSSGSAKEACHYAYEQALADNINSVCNVEKMSPSRNAFTAQGVREKSPKGTDPDPAVAGLNILTDQDLLKEHCPNPPEKFIRYVYWVHKSVIGKKKYAETLVSKTNPEGTGSAIIAHLAEGRRTDTYNTREFEMVKLLGMDQPHVNFVHGVGIDQNGFKHMADRQMGLIWSPFSNMLLYNETLDIKAAIEQGVILAMGSDWLPTGSKGPLEELKIAYAYVIDQKLKGVLKTMPGASSAEEALYKMVTENPAKMINHWQKGSDDPDWENGEGMYGIGTLAKGAMGSVIVTSKLDNNPFKNLVAEVWETDVNLVVVDGKVQYGNTQYLDQVSPDYETIPNVNGGNQGESGMANIIDVVPVEEALINSHPKAKKDDKTAFLDYLATVIDANASDIAVDIQCEFSGEKGFVLQSTKDGGKGKLIADLDLDRFKDIQRIIGINLMTQSRNRVDDDKGDPAFAPTHFTALYTCNDQKHKTRVTQFISETWPTDRTNREQTIKNQKLGRTPERMAEKYPN